MSETQDKMEDDKDDELEEGELRDDDDDDDDLTTPEMVDPRERLLSNEQTSEGKNNINGIPLADDLNVGGQVTKKKKRVVRKVKRKIKVIKKVAKKKNESQQQQQHQPQQHQQQHPQQTMPLLPHINRQQANPKDQQQITVDENAVLAPLPTTTLAPSIAATSTHLWEQQILMLQQLQKQQQQPSTQYDQILRAAATDEDLRCLQPSLQVLSHQNFLAPNTTASSLAWPSQMGPTQGQQTLLPQQPQQQQHQPQPMQQQQLLQPQQQQQIHSQDPRRQLNRTPQAGPTTIAQQQPAQQTSDRLENTPTSPDEERSSYEAISKMLNMLKNSGGTDDTVNDADGQIDKDSNPKPKYSLIPIQIAGIDYTKYKLLAQYEAKFRSDPRLGIT